MNNREWLYSLDVADLSDWFDAEHVETKEQALDGDTEPENEDSRERLEADIEEWASIMDLEDQIDMIHGWLNRRAAILEREMVKFNRRYFDCVEQEKKIAELTRKMEILKAHGVEIVDAVAGGYEVYNEKIREVSELQEKVDKLTAERDKLQEQLRIGWECECRLQAERDKFKEANDYHAAQYELASEDADRLQAQVDELKAERVKLRSQICKLEDDLVGISDERDNWKANCEDWKNHARAAENACYETMLEREDYRKKFGKCIDYADAIHALMDDEGMA